MAIIFGGGFALAGGGGGSYGGGGGFALAGLIALYRVRENI